MKRNSGISTRINAEISFGFSRKLSMSIDGRRYTKL